MKVRVAHLALVAGLCALGVSAVACSGDAPTAARGTPTVDAAANDVTTTFDSGSGEPDADAGDPTPDEPVELARSYGESMCAIFKSGRVACWGKNDFGQLGLPKSATPVSSPTWMPNVTDAVSMAVGSRHSCIVHKDGALTCVGDNRRGQLGVPLATSGPDTEQRQRVTLSAGALRVSAGDEQTCVVLKDQTLWCMGRPYFPCVAGLTGAPDVNAPAEPTPRRVSTLQFEDVVTYYTHTCAISAGTKDVYCAGPSFWGETGVAPSQTCTALSKVSTSSSTFSSLALGIVHTCGVRVNEVQCLGMAQGGQLGRPTNSTPNVNMRRLVDFKDTTPVESISAGAQSTCVRHRSGQVECVGTNSAGQLGRAISPGPQSDIPDYVQGIADARSISMSLSAACALMKPAAGEPTIACWGSNSDGQLGRGSVGAGAFPKPEVITLPK
jgi:alpha-tubulin suppressor-like RCC1 family protein